PGARIRIGLGRLPELAGRGRDARVVLVGVRELVRLVELRLGERRGRLATRRCAAGGTAGRAAAALARHQTDRDTDDQGLVHAVLVGGRPSYPVARVSTSAVRGAARSHGVRAET